jgi:hypothetical protein
VKACAFIIKETPGEAYPQSKERKKKNETTTNYLMEKRTSPVFSNQSQVRNHHPYRLGRCSQEENGVNQINQQK